MRWFRRGREQVVDAGRGLASTDKSPAEDETSTEPSAVVSAANALTASWAGVQGRENTALSGVGCWVLLAMLAAGADGDARAELGSAVGLPAEDGLRGTTDMMALLGSIRPLKAAAAIWARVVLDPEWLDGLPPGTGVHPLTNDPAVDQLAANAWVSAATDGELARIPIGLSDRTRMLLASALVLRVDWIKEFDERGEFDHGAWADRGIPRLTTHSTDLGRLQVVGGADGPVTMVAIPAEHGIDVHLVRGATDAAPGLVLSTAIAALGSREQRTSGVDLPDGTPAPGVHAQTVTSRLPDDSLRVETCPFDFSTSHDLLRHADVFGLGAATDPSRGHFPALSAAPLAIDQACQQVTATFTRTGFRAAAVTAVSMMVGSAPPGREEEHRVRRISVSFDEPFGFLAVDRESGLVLIAGWVDDPHPGAGAAPAPS